jgi:hypothetical protein
MKPERLRKGGGSASCHSKDHRERLCPPKDFGGRSSGVTRRCRPCEDRIRVVDRQVLAAPSIHLFGGPRLSSLPSPGDDGLAQTAGANSPHPGPPLRP